MLDSVDLFAIDDSAQRKPTRDGMGPLVAVGGVHVDGSAVRDVEFQLERLCADACFPPGEEFKWSPSKKSWMRRGLVDAARQTFFLDTLSLARSLGVTVIVAMEDTTKQKASKKSETHTDDVTMMFLERAQSQLAGDKHGLIVFDRSGGSHQTDFNFLASCMDKLRAGTAYTKLNRLALALSTDSRLSRIVQLADVVTACATSFVSGERNWAPKVFNDGVLPILREDLGRKGGCGLKIHPDFRYGNLYHWLLGDKEFIRYQLGVALPSSKFTCYRESPDVA
jgi:hypothetical protein